MTMNMGHEAVAVCGNQTKIKTDIKELLKVSMFTADGATSNETLEAKGNVNCKGNYNKNLLAAAAKQYNFCAIL